MAGCQICMKLLSWVNSIENGPDWNEILGGPAPWGFTITCDLSKDVTTADKLELSFRITRYGSVWSHADESAHVMTLKILPVKKPGIFSWVKINRIKDGTVVAIAAENKVTRDKRMILKARKVAIEEARDICANLAMRKELRTYGKDESGDAEESFDEEESSLPLPSEQQRTSPRPTRVAGSAASIPFKSQRRPSHEERPQTTPAKSDIVTNGSVGPGHDDGFAFGAETAVGGNHSKARMNLPSFPGGWDDQPATEYHPSVMNAPQYAPPPPPRSEKIRHQTEGQYYPPSPPDSGSRQPYPVHEQYPVQPYRTELNGHQHSNSYPQSDLNGAPTYVNNYPQSPAKKPLRKLLGSKT